jgi:hypothetical protein
VNFEYLRAVLKRVKCKSAGNQRENRIEAKDNAQADHGFPEITEDVVFLRIIIRSKSEKLEWVPPQAHHPQSSGLTRTYP